MTDDFRTLGDLVIMSSGKSIIPGGVGPYPVYGSNGLIGGTDEHLFDSGCILGRVGAYCGSVELSLQPFWASDNTIVITPRDPESTSLRFLYYALTAANLNRHAGGAAQPLLTQRDLRPIRIYHPPLLIQCKIAGVLSAYDDLIENNNRRIKLLEEMAQRIYREWFVDFRYPGHEAVPLVDSELGRIPVGWQWKFASEAISINPKVAIARDVSHPFIPMTSLSEMGMHIEPLESRVGTSGAKFQNGDTLFARITPCLENGKTAFVQCLAESEVATGSTEFIVLRSSFLSPELVYLLARSNAFRGHAMKSMSGATGRQRVREECFERFPIPMPAGDLIQIFTDHVRPMFHISFRLFLANRNLRLTRDLLLPRLISGQIDVGDLDIAVPEVAA